MGSSKPEIPLSTTSALCTSLKMSATRCLRRMYATKATEQSLKAVASVPIAQSKTVSKVLLADSKAESSGISEATAPSSPAAPTPYKPLNVPAALARQRQEATPTTAVQWGVRSREASKVRGRAFSRFDSG